MNNANPSSFLNLEQPESAQVLKTEACLSELRSVQHGRIEVLDGLRGVAIILVLMVHVEAFLAPWSALLPKALLVVTRNLFVGVDLFFVLSGFLITNILLRTRDLPTKRALGTFYMRRVLRIFPLYYFAIAINFIVIPLMRGGMGSSRSQQLEQVSYLVFLSNWLQSWRGVSLGGFMAVAWSLAIEEQFYLVWPWVARAVTVQVLKQICIVILILSPLIRIVAWQFGVNLEVIYVFTPFRLDGLAAGALLAILMYGKKDFSPATLLISKRLVFSTLFVYSAFVVLALLFPVSGTAFDNMGYFRNHPLMYTLGYSVTAACFASLIFIVLNAVGPAKEFFSNRLLTKAGKFSFSIYLFHVIIGYYATKGFVAARFFGLGTGWLSLSLYLAGWTALLFAFAELTWLTIEQPVLRLKKLF